MPTEVSVNTATSIRRQLSEGAEQPVEHHQIVYAIRKLGIQPIGRAGVVPFYSDADVRRIRAELNRIAAWRAHNLSSTCVRAV